MTKQELQDLRFAIREEHYVRTRLDMSDWNNDARIARLLKDRLEGLEDVVRVENLNDKVGA
jgi:chorismate mutase